MDSYQPTHHSYMRPPPPPTPPPAPHAPPSFGSDPQHPHQLHHYQQQYLPTPPPPPPPPPQQYSAQFQYQHNQWGPPPMPPPPSCPAHSHASYPAPLPYPNQEWGNGNWTHHSGWEYPSANSNEEDWAAKAKAWASTRASMENHLPQPATRQEDPSPYANQYLQPVESHYQDVQQTFVPASGFSSHQGPEIHHQELASVSSYISEPCIAFSAKDEVSGGDTNAGFTQRSDQTSSSVYPQEVPSCYSSFPGHEDGVHGKQHENSSLTGDSRVMPVDHAQFAYGSHPLDQMNQPLEFASRFSHEIDQKMISTYPDSSVPVSGTDSVASVSSFHSWSVPAAPGAPYPPNAPAFPSSNQHYSVDVHSLPGQHSPLFGTGPGFQPPVPNHVGMSDGMGLHPAVAFPVDAYGITMSAERPKKAAVPNWLREEIVKTKATIARSAPDQLKEGSQSVEDDLVDKPIETGDQEDSKSLGSAMSAEEDDDDEDEEDVHRTAAINQEIKRVLTEVLLKVTDDLFDEIATKVLSEDDNVPNGDSRAPKVSTPPLLAPKESAKVMIPAKVKDTAEHASEETSLGAPANLLGLSNYASDDDEEDQASSIPKVDSNGAPGASENAEEHKLNQDFAFYNSNAKPTGVHPDYGLPASKLSDHRFTLDLVSTDDFPPNSGTESTVSEGEKGRVVSDAAKSADNGGKVTVNGADALDPRKLPRDGSQERGIKKHERHESKRTSAVRDNYKETVRNREKEAEKDAISSQRDERHNKKDNTKDAKSERVRDKKPRSPRHVEKARDSDSSKNSPRREGKDKSDSKYERGRDKNRSSKNGDRKRDRTKDEKNDKSRHKSIERHKRRRSSSVGSWEKATKKSPVVSDGSSDGVSEDFRRKSRSKRRNLSPSPARSRRRQVSRSPHSKHTQQRQHSPYSSLDDSRGKRSRSRSRSRSPVRRHRR